MCGIVGYVGAQEAAPILLDGLRRLEYRGYEVTFVQNFTDVDDKIIKRANEEGISSEEVAKKIHRRVLYRRTRARRPRGDRAPEGHREHPADHRPHHDAHRQGLRLRGQR